MSGLRPDIFGLDQIYLITRNFTHWKSRSRAKMMHLGPDKFTITKLDNMKLREITGTIRSNINSKIQI
jgi:hypothetical protein